MRYLFAVSLLLSGCCSICPHPAFSNVTSYRVHHNKVTPKGVQVDTGEFLIDLKALDERIDKIDQCLQEVAKQHPVLTVEEMNSWGCMSNRMPTTPLKRCCFFIKIVSPVGSKCQSTWQLLPDAAPEALCRAKGLEVSPECPCRWRAALQDNMSIITPPALYLWELVKWHTGCGNFWNSPFAKCGGVGYGY